VSIDQAVELGRGAVVMTLMIGAPVMAIAVIAGLLISMFQAVTQLQDQTLSFVPKIIAMFVTMLYILPWVMNLMIEYSTELIREIPSGM
jgi:flagellar biosynthetic protein FliQ